MGFLLDFCVISTYVISMVVLWNFSGISEGCLWDFHWISIRFLWDLYGISMIFLWDFSVISEDFHEISIGFL